MTPEQALRAAAAAAQAVHAVSNGNHLVAAAHAADALLELLPPDEARKVVDEAVVRRAHLAREVVELEKFGPKP